MCGLTLERSQENLAITFLAMIQGLAYGTKHIAQELQRYFQILSLNISLSAISKCMKLDNYLKLIIFRFSGKVMKLRLQQSAVVWLKVIFSFKQMQMYCN